MEQHLIEKHGVTQVHWGVRPRGRRASGACHVSWALQPERGQGGVNGHRGT